MSEETVAPTISSGPLIDPETFDDDTVMYWVGGFTDAGTFDAETAGATINLNP